MSHISQELRDHVREVRESQLGLTQAEFADQAGVKLRTYQSFESGEHKTQRGSLKKILAAVGLDENDHPSVVARISQDTAAETRAAWPNDVEVFRDVVAAFLMTVPDDEARLELIRSETRRIVNAFAETVRPR